MSVQPPLLDQYAPLSHKQSIGPNADNATASLAPTWVPRLDRRRLDAYRIRASYRLNVARYMVRTETTQVPGGTTVDTTDIEDRREYGDAALLIDRVIAGVLGDNFEIVVDGADADLPDEPELPDEPQDPGPNATEVQKRMFEIRQRLWTDTVNSILGDWEQAWTEQPGLLERQQWLRDWADVELFASKIVEAEEDICGLGDGVYVVTLSGEKRRPIIDVYDPGMYFPVLTDTTRGYPRKVHLAWEYEEDDELGRTTRWVRRLTWEIDPIIPQLSNTGDFLFDGARFVLKPPIQLADGKVLQDRFATPADIAAGMPPGAVVRDYPWNFDDDDKPLPSNETCYFTDARWKLQDLQSRKLDVFDETNAIFATTGDGNLARRLDLRHDFLPVIHIPNMPASREHYGQSVIDLITQILDDIQIGDTDINDAAALAAGPAITLSGEKTIDELTVRPGAMYNVGANGRMDVLDLSKGLAELAKIQDGRLDRLSVNGRVPNEVLGRAPDTAATSGVHELLRFGPFIQLVGKLRMPREPKGRLLLKFVQRLGQLAGELPPGPNPSARIAFGSFLPSDRAQVVEQVTKLLQAKAISTQTAVAFLVAAGFTVDDARGEVQRIRAENGATAVQIATAIATGDSAGDQAAADWLGIEIPTPPNPPPVPPAPPGPPVPDLPAPPAP